MLNKLPRGLKRGDLVELTLTPDAVMYSDSHEFFMSDLDKETNIQGRIYAGYVIEIEKGEKCEQNEKFRYLSLSSDWNPTKDRPEYGGKKFYFEAIESCTRLKRKLDFMKTLSMALEGFNVIGKAYGSFSRQK